MPLRDVARAGAKRTQAWLRADRRLERILRRGRLSGPQTLYSHEVVVPMTSTYAPWYDDSGFRSVYDAVDGSTLVDQYKCYELWEQLGQLRHVDGDILEVGVWRGGTGVIMAQRAKQLGMGARVFLADTFQGVVNAGADDPWYRGGEHSDTSADMVRSLAAAQAVDVELLVGMFPHDTADAIADHAFRFVHIDVDVYQSARETLEWAWSRLSVGGAVVFDDYGAFECEGVATLGREMFDANQGSFRLLHNLNGHLVMLKLTAEPLPSFGTAT